MSEWVVLHRKRVTGRMMSVQIYRKTDGRIGIISILLRLLTKRQRMFGIHYHAALLQHCNPLSNHGCKSTIFSHLIEFTDYGAILN